MSHSDTNSSLVFNLNNVVKYVHRCEISSSHGGEYDVLGCTAV
jgi:hypothetical protein